MNLQAQLRAVSCEPYSDVRHRLRSGDVVTFDGDHLLGRAIRLFAGPGTHTAMVLRLVQAPEHVFLLEAMETGLSLTRLSRRISNYLGRVYVTAAPASPKQRQAMTAHALRLLGARVRYDYLSLVRNAWRRVPLNMGRGYCTESVQYIHQEAGVLPPRDLAMVPGEYLAMDGWPVFRIAPYTAEGE